MAKSEATLTKELISMASSISYLAEMERVLRKKPVIPKSVQAVMAPAAAELETLLNHFNVVRAQADACAQPTIAELLRISLNKEVGDAVSGKVHMSGARIEFSGVLEKAAIWLPESPSTSANRCLNFLMRPATMTFNGERINSAERFKELCLSGNARYINHLVVLDGPDGIGVVYSCYLGNKPELV